VTDKPWAPEDLFKPSKEYPQGSSGEWMAEENGVMVRKIYRDGKLVATEIIQLAEIIQLEKPI
jgi:hypothetical protein